MSIGPTPGSRGRSVHRLLRVFGWTVGAPLAIFRFLRRATPIERDETSAADASWVADDGGRALERGKSSAGPVVHTLYRAAIRAPKLSAAQLVNIVAADPNVIVPSEVLRFERADETPGELREGDQVLIRMAGPWDGPVQVTRRWEEGLCLTALRGHPLLGEMELRAHDEGGEITVEIETREQAAGPVFFLLARTGLIRRMQTHAWAEMLENAAQLAGGRRLERITMRTATRR